MQSQKYLPLLVAALIASPAWGQCELDKFLGSQASSGDRFGRSVANTASAAFIGAPFDSTSGNASGNVHVFRRVGLNWPESQVLTGSQTTNSDNFGASLAVFETQLAVGSPYEEGGSGDWGGVYLFGFNGGVWTETQLFTAPDGALGDLFGTSVDLNADTLVIGSPQDDDQGQN